MSDLNIVVTGATAGVGRQVLQDLAERGHRLIAADADEDALARLRSDWDAGELVTLPLDVARSRSFDTATRIVDTVTGGRGADVLVNYGGGSSAHVSLDVEAAAADTAGLESLLAVTEAFAKPMRDRGFGRIVNVSGIAGWVAAGKKRTAHVGLAALRSVSNILRRELRDYGIRVAFVAPKDGAFALSDRVPDLAIPSSRSGPSSAIETYASSVDALICAIRAEVEGTAERLHATEGERVELPEAARSRVARTTARITGRPPAL